jgi:hypothetical protein
MAASHGYAPAIEEQTTRACEKEWAWGREVCLCEAIKAGPANVFLVVGAVCELFSAMTNAEDKFFSHFCPSVGTQIGLLH